MIRIKIEYPSFADTTLAKLLIKLAKWRNWNSTGKTMMRGTPGGWGDEYSIEITGTYISRTRWNFRLASKVATKFKLWEENREAAKMKKRFAPLMKVIKPEVGLAAGFDQEVYALMVETKNSKL